MTTMSPAPSVSGRPTLRPTLPSIALPPASSRAVSGGAAPERSHRDAIARSRKLSKSGSMGAGALAAADSEEAAAPEAAGPSLMSTTGGSSVTSIRWPSSATKGRSCDRASKKAASSSSRGTRPVPSTESTTGNAGSLVPSESLQIASAAGPLGFTTIAATSATSSEPSVLPAAAATASAAASAAASAGTFSPFRFDDRSWPRRASALATSAARCSLRETIALAMRRGIRWSDSSGSSASSSASAAARTRSSRSGTALVERAIALFQRSAARGSFMIALRHLASAPFGALANWMASSR